MSDTPATGLGPTSNNFIAGMPPSQGTGIVPPVRIAFQQIPGGRGGYFYYTGTGLVDQNSRIALPGPYSLDEKNAGNIYASMSVEDRARNFSILQRKGFYGGRQPGVYDNDINAIQGMLDWSNHQGVTWERALNDMQRAVPDYKGGGGGGVRRYRVSNPADLKDALNKAALDTIGRAFTDAELASAIPGYQQAEKNAQAAYYQGGTVTEAPSVQAFGRGAAQFFAPNEANAYKFLGIMNRIFNATSGGQ